MSSNDTIKKTFIVAIVLCLVCSVVVSFAAVMLRPLQAANQAAFLKRNVLQAAHMYDPDVPLEEQFEQFTPRIVDLKKGQFTDEISPENFDQERAAKDPQRSINIPEDEDVAGIGRRSNYVKAYTLETDEGVEMVVLPIKGYGLWGTLYGFLALESDGNTVVGLSYYDHQETPGLGGEVDNPRWKNLWQDKKIYNDEEEVAITVIKGSVDSGDPRSEYKVDGLAGATLTSRGVHQMFQYWLGESGYKEFLSNLRRGEA